MPVARNESDNFSGRETRKVGASRVYGPYQAIKQNFDFGGGGSVTHAVTSTRGYVCVDTKQGRSQNFILGVA